MCGIAGCFRYNNGSEIGINTMKAKMCNRGPDNFDYYKDDKIILFHSRLSIIDKSDNGNQPFVTSSHVFAYNGELYNYKELAEKYKASPHIAACDGRVFFALLRQQGFEKALEEADGMFALAYYNRDKKELHLARDCFGEKPLYVYRSSKGRVYFASQISYLLAMVDAPLEINHNMVNKYLFNGYRSLFKDPTETFFKNVTVVEPGTYAKFSLSKFGVTDYTYRFFNPVVEKTDSVITVQDLRKQIEYIVETRLRSDVPLAFCQSGGVDSNLLITTAKRVFGYDVHGYTIGNQDSRYDESSTVNRVAKQLGTRHTYVDVGGRSDSFLDDLKTIIRNNGSPLVTISYYLHWLLLKAISKDGYRVSISGTGGDELFSGYYDHHLYYIAQSKDKYKAVEKWKSVVETDVRNPVLKNHMLFVNNHSYRNYLYPNRKYLMFSTMMPPEHFYEDMLNNDTLKNRMCNELFRETVPPILHDDDLNSMFFSVENRSPLLQKDLYRMAMSMDSERYIVEGVAKHPLRSVFFDIAPDVAGLVPVKKTGFNASLFSVYPDYKQYLFDSGSPVWDIVDRDAVVREDFTEADSMFLFNLLNVKMFLELF